MTRGEGGYDKMTIEDGLMVLKDTLAETDHASAARLLQRAREEIRCLRGVVRDVRIMANSGQFKQWDGEPWLKRVNNINLHW
jgi:hypothetical protein